MTIPLKDIPADIRTAAFKALNATDDMGGAFFVERIKIIANALLAERQRSPWQTIDTAPKDGTAIDLWGVNHLHTVKKGHRVTNVTWGPVRDWMGRERDDWQHGYGEEFEPTHWMPLPAAPKGGDE